MNAGIIATATRLYNDLTPSRERAERDMAAGLTVKPVVFATIEEIAAHIGMCEEVGREYGVNVKYQHIEFGASVDDVIAHAEKKAKNKRKRAGVEALKAKYGKEAAERIIQKHTGHRYNLQ
jgi:hypothetical protein